MACLLVVWVFITMFKNSTYIYFTKLSPSAIMGCNKVLPAPPCVGIKLHEILLEDGNNQCIKLCKLESYKWKFLYFKMYAKFHETVRETLKIIHLISLRAFIWSSLKFFSPAKELNCSMGRLIICSTSTADSPIDSANDSFLVFWRLMDSGESPYSDLE